MENSETNRRSRRLSELARQRKKKTEASINLKKWTEQEQLKLLHYMKVYGHKDIDKISLKLKTRTKEEIKKFMINAHSQARKKSSEFSNVQYWLDRSKIETKKANTSSSIYSYLPSQVMKFLSVDGLLENHPKPESCGGIKFKAAYRLIYQALMGYPIQPVNKPTADFISKCISNVFGYKNLNLIQDMTEFLKKKYGGNVTGRISSISPFNAASINLNVCSNFGQMVGNSSNKKPLMVYKRKNTSSVMPNTENVTPLKVVLVEKGVNESGNLKSYSVSVEGISEDTDVMVPVQIPADRKEVEKSALNLWENVEFNPFSLPVEYLRNTVVKTE